MNRRHADFQAEPNTNISTAYGCTACQTAPDKSNTYTDFVKPETYPKKENPGTASTVTGANVEKSKALPEYLERLKRARDLQAAIEACDPALAAIIMDQELENLRIGEPQTALLNAMNQAVTWAEWATPAEHKAYCLACYNAMPPKARAGFLHYVQGRNEA